MAGARSAAAPRPPAGLDADLRAPRPRLSDRASELLARRSGRVRVAGRPRRPAARPAARSSELPAAHRARTLAAGVALSPVALALGVGEVLARAGGTVYVEARR